MHQLELNSPAGDWDCLKAAIYNGASSVYLGIKFFNARRLAKNFSLQELKDAVFFAHLHEVKIYLTLNILVRNEELPLWFKTLEEAYLAGIDAVIIQEISLAPMIKQAFPGLRIHASTQASLMNYQGINQFPDLDLVVLARELTYTEIKSIREHTNKELEVFVHGHLCISYSGQCLISSLIGKRSGNRGVCASSCRKNYNQQGYLISAKDLMLANSIDKIYTLGINVVKIEGRMKSPEYVAATTRTYRQQIDAVQEKHFKPLSEQQVNNLKMGFNRDFTTGFFNNNPSIVGAEMPMNRGIFLGTIQDGGLQLEHDLNLLDGVGFWHSRSDGKLKGGIAYKILSEGEEIKHARRGDKIKIVSPYFINNAKVYLTSHNEGQDVLAENLLSLSLNVIAKVDQPLMFQYNDIIVHSSINLQAAQKQALTEEQLRSELEKSSYFGIHWDIKDLQLENVFLPKRFLHQIREALELKLREKVVPNRVSKFTSVPAVIPSAVEHQPRLIVKVYSLTQLQEANAAGVEIIYYDIFNSDVYEAKRLCTRAKFFLDTPVVATDSDIERIQQIVDTIKPDGITIGNWGILGVVFNGEKHGKYSLNVFNDISSAALLAQGVLPTLSVELNAKQALKMQNKKLIYYAHGQLPVMHFKGVYSPKVLTDEKKYTFPLRTVNGNTEMLYSRPIAVLDKVKELMDGGVKYFLLDLTKDTSKIIKSYQNILLGVEQDISFLKKGTTLGNYGKGVA
ncbi:MAG TPA: U32 family peptidase [Candidatus Nanoarchaeia archaeon]|nr:U32 family peptidase [Candidatus Nanoarchaeia archaeon]